MSHAKLLHTITKWPPSKATKGSKKLNFSIIRYLCVCNFAVHLSTDLRLYCICVSDTCGKGVTLQPPERPRR